MTIPKRAKQYRCFLNIITYILVISFSLQSTVYAGSSPFNSSQADKLAPWSMFQKEEKGMTGTVPFSAPRNEDLRKLEILRDLISEKLREADNKRPVVIRILGAAGTGKSVFANAIRDGLNGLRDGGVFIYDDSDIPRLVHARIFNRHGILTEHKDAKVILVVGLLGAKILRNDDVDINVLLKADKDTIRRNFGEKIERFTPEQLEMALTIEGERRGLGRKARRGELLVEDPDDRELDMEISLPGVKKDFVFDMSRDNRPTADEVKGVFRSGAVVSQKTDELTKIRRVADTGISYLKEVLGGGKRLGDRIIWTGINSVNPDTKLSADMPKDELLYTLISVGNNVFKTIEWKWRLGEFADLPFMVIKDAVTKMLLRNGGEFLSAQLERMLGRKVDLEDEIEWIWIDKYQEGSEAGVFKVTVHLKDGSETVFGIISAKNSGLGSTVVKNDRNNLDMVGRLYKDFNETRGDISPSDVPRVFGGDSVTVDYQGRPQNIYMFAAGWLDGLYEVHPIANIRSGELVFAGLERGVSRKGWDIRTSMMIREKSIIIAATIFELTNGRLARVLYTSGDIVAGVNDEGVVEDVRLITIPYFLNDSKSSITSIVDPDNIFRGIQELMKKYNLEGASLDERYLLFIMNFLYSSSDMYGVDDKWRLTEDTSAHSLFPEPEVVFSGITKALVRMYGEKEGIRRVVSIFEKFTQKNTEYRRQALEYLDSLREKYGIGRDEKEGGLREHLQGIKPGSYESVRLGRLAEKFELDERMVRTILGELGFRPISGDEDRWKRAGRGRQTPLFPEKPKAMELFPVNNRGRESGRYYFDGIVVNGERFTNPIGIVREAGRMIKRNSMMFKMEVNGIGDDYIVIGYREKYFVVRKKLLDLLGYSEEEFKTHLAGAVERQKRAREAIKDISPRYPETVKTGLEFSNLPEVMVVELMRASPYMGANCAGDGWIGVNECLGRMPDKEFRDIVFESVLLHELWHEANIFSREKDAASLDILFLFWTIFESGLTFDGFEKVFRSFIGNRGLFDNFLFTKNEIIRGLMERMTGDIPSLRKKSAETLIRLGQKFDSKAGFIFPGDMKNWLKRHGLLEGGEAEEPKGFEEKRRRMYERMRKNRVRAREAAGRFCKRHGIQESVNSGCLDEIIRWMVDAHFSEDIKISGGKLFGENIDRKRFEDLAIWPVDSYGRLRPDLMNWMWHWSWKRGPLEEYVSARKVSLKEYCKMEMYAEPHQVGLGFRAAVPPAEHIIYLEDTRSDIKDSV